MNRENVQILAKAKVRFTIDVDVTVSNLPKALLAGEVVVDDYSNKREDDRKFIDFQQRLLEAILENVETFQAITVSQAGYEASTKFEERWIYSNPEEDQMKSLIMETAKSMMTTEQWEELKRMSDEGSFDVFSSLLSNSWQAFPGEISIEMIVQKQSLSPLE